MHHLCAYKFNDLYLSVLIGFSYNELVSFMQTHAHNPFFKVLFNNGIN